MSYEYVRLASSRVNFHTVGLTSGDDDEDDGGGGCTCAENSARQHPLGVDVLFQTLFEQ